MDTVRKLIGIVKGKKGIAVIYIALILVAMVAFVGLAVDIGYMYVAKGQLQNAADAAALAGAIKLDGAPDDKVKGTNNYEEAAARREAWKFACENTAAQQNIYIDTSPANSSPPTSCSEYSTIDTDVLNGKDNDPKGQIVVGNWDADAKKFTAATGKTGLSINAMVVKAMRTSTSRGGPVSIFFARVFSSVFRTMGAAATAGAVRTNVSIFSIPLCFVSCELQTPLNVDSAWQNTTPGSRFYLRSNDDTTSGQTHTTAWTAFFETTSKPNVIDYLNGTKVPPNICNQCISTNQGQIVPASCALLDVINRLKKTYDITDTSGKTFHITGIKGLLPIVTACPGGSGRACMTDPGYQPGDPFVVTKYTEVIITDSIPESNKCKGNATTAGPEGIVMVGTSVPSGTPAGFSVMHCIDCSTSTPDYGNVGAVLFQ